MPELPEVEALAHHLREHAVGKTVFRVDVASLSVLKTATPPWTELHGREVTEYGRFGKHLDLVVGELHLVVHLARAGWLRWSDALAAGAAQTGQGADLAARPPRRGRRAGLRSHGGRDEEGAGGLDRA